ncbi:alpha-1,2-mannosyltransferase [Aspergillus sclerotialis]|uniref:Alpha-1,2-mannosyltransferase n=1 Tax=Aspergillus sclerotialis TaxID=2070753 RepID=A0A3A2ZI01_9EURO|nr:alpha-1,2-mannosyltransferase [Aspergillus sclerotialis]
MALIRRVRLRTVLFATAAILLICTFYLYWTPTPASMVPSTAFEVPLTERQKDFWKGLKPILEKNAPNCPPPERHGNANSVHFNAITPDPRPDLITMSDEDQTAMEEAHRNFLKDVRESKLLRPAHTPGTRGLVSTAGDSYFPVFLSSLRTLRRTGSTLPVEVYMKDSSEYEKEICDKVLPDLNARCLVLSDVVGKGSVSIAHFQLKIFAILFSSFEEIVWMDADCFPLYKPEDLLDSEPFTSTGLVTWPDFWGSTVSPTYFKISQQEIPPMTARQSSETGVILVSKRNHFVSLLLSAYYNYYGPSHYFGLLSQGAQGEGDKETFIQAASAVGEPFYTVSERVQAIGHSKPGDLSGSAMVQTDPTEDHALTSQGKWRVEDPSVAKPPRVFFIHAHYPKFNPGGEVFGMQSETTPTVKPDGSDGRAWTAPEDTLKRLGYDVEKNYWEEIKWVSCNLEDKFRTWKDKSGICERVESYWRNVFAEPHDDDPVFTDDG